MVREVVRSIDADWMAERLQDWPDGAGPMYQRLARAVERLLHAGEVSDGARLPAERLLARSLQVSRTTVAAAYAVLEDRRLVARRHGSGTYVQGIAKPLPAPREATLLRSLERNQIIAGLIDPPTRLLDLRAAALHDAEDIPAEAFAGLEGDLRGMIDGHGYVPAGLTQLRQSIADTYTVQGLPTTVDEVLVTSGAQQAISLITMLHLRAGDRVVCEAVTHTGALDLFTAAGADIDTVPIDRRGADVDAVAAALEDRPTKLLYLIPSVHNPLGAVMPARSRRQLGAVVDEHPDTVVVSDDTLAETYRDRRPPPPLASYPGGAGVLHVGSVSKLLWGGLRVGWVRGPVAEIRHLVRLKALTDLGTSIPAQLVAQRLLAQGELMAERRRAVIAARGRAMESALAEALPEWHFVEPEGGLCLWVQLPFGSARDMTLSAARHGLAVAPGTIHSPTGDHARSLRLAYGHPEPVLRAAVTRLAAAWRDFAGASDRSHLDDLQVVV